MAGFMQHRYVTKPFSKPIYVTRPLLPSLEEMIGQLKEIWASQCLTNGGPKHAQLEEKLKELLQVPQLSLFNNGTVALMVACQSLRLTGEVITTPFTFPATPHALTWNKIRPVFCDIDPHTLTLDADRLEERITAKTTAILGVHVYGVPCDVDKIQAVADRYGLRVLYDAAHAFGVTIDKQGIGTFGDISMFSFHATKLFHTAEGGALTFNDPSLKRRIDLLKNFGINGEEEVLESGINGKMNELQAALGLLVTRSLNEEYSRRDKIIRLYQEQLSGIAGIRLVSPAANIRNNYQYCVIRIDESMFGKSRDELHTFLRGYNVHTRKYFYPLCSDYPCYQNLSSNNSNTLPVAHQVVQEVLCLPLYGDLPLRDVEKICALIKECQSADRKGQVINIRARTFVQKIPFQA